MRCITTYLYMRFRQLVAAAGYYEADVRLTEDGEIVVFAFDGDALHFHKPGGTADGGLKYDQGELFRNTCPGDLFEGNLGVVRISEIESPPFDILEFRSAFGKERPDIFQHAPGLEPHVADVNDVSLLINTGGSGNIKL